MSISRGLLLGALLFASASALWGGEEGEFSRQPPEKIMTARACGECHINALALWEETPHATGFKTLHRKETAEEIARKMGFRLIKRESLCLRCHYTTQVVDGQERAVSGVSCESCHGAARDWINVHNDYGGKGITYQTETAQHREERLRAVRAAGMRRPDDLYRLASSCFGCHLVPEERLVNVGGHSTGSGNFELVARTQGEIRHNFLQSLRTGSTPVNAERPMTRKRSMWVVGRALELEHTLRAVAAAREEGVYVKAMVRRARNAVAELREIAARTELPEVERMLEIVRGVQVKLGNQAALLAAADQVGTATRHFLEQRDGEQLAALDPLILGTAGSLAVAVAEQEEAPPPAGETAAGEEPVAAADGAVAGTDAEATSAGTSEPRAADRGLGPIRTRLRPPESHATLGPGACSGCHAPQNEWWFNDEHYTSAEPFFDQQPENTQIARLYGISTRDMTRGTALCMDCHGTIVTGKERREVLDGVGCESCHGPAKDWLEPHKDETDKHLGRERPGYRAALQQGKRDLRSLEQQARVCTGCHYVTEPRLLSAGHPSGVDFDYVEGLRKTRHWERPLDGAPQIVAAFSAALDDRGGVPDVARAVLADAAQASGTGEPGRSGAGAGAAGGSTSSPRAGAEVAGRDGSAASAGRRSAAGAAPSGADEERVRGWPGVDTAAFPEIDETTSVEEILLLLKARLESLYPEARE